jgi:hypothetical protein
MKHVVEVQLRLHLDEAELRSSETPVDAATRIIEDGVCASEITAPESIEFHELVGLGNDLRALDRQVGLTD